MTDIVERLRFMEHSASMAAAPVIKEAADEIERLRTDVAWWEHQYGIAQTEIERLRADNKRLRDASVEQIERA